MKKIILASASPRRRELLAMLDLDFRIAEPYHIQEIYPQGMDPHKVPQYLAKLKSEAYPWALSEDEVLVTADTVVILGNKVIGKPESAAHAAQILRQLSGAQHTVVTGVWLRSADKEHGFSVSTDVYFSQLTNRQIDYYVQKYNPMDKAGAYGVQEWIGLVAIEYIEGSFYNVMGLPTSHLMAALDDF